MSDQQGPIPNLEYDLVSIVYHASQAVPSADRYAEDARYSRLTELAAFFENVRNQNADRAREGLALLRKLEAQAGLEGGGGKPEGRYS